MKFSIVILFSSVFTLSNAQTNFITHGKVEFEKKVNQYKIFADEEDESESSWMQEMKKTIPQFVNDVYELKFSPTKSFYKLKNENENNKYMWGVKPSDNDFCFQDLNNNKTTLRKDVYEQTYIIDDSTKIFHWKITGETREIAGFECKKAVTKICDSVYIVAFYTEQIICSSGPESFGGLPGLILGLAVPRLHTTWFATKLELTNNEEPQLPLKLKGTKINYSSLNKEMQKALKDWGKYGSKKIWSFNL